VLAFATIVSMLVTADELVARKPAPEAQSVGKTLINRASKGDRLVSARPNAELVEKITIVEVIDVRDVAIIYRSRTGEVVLFTDLVNSITTVAKSVELPEVTARNTLQRTIQQGPVEDLRDTERQRTLHPGCFVEASPTFSSAWSQRAVQQRAVQRAVRCIADITVAIKTIQPL
jgi:hypothetical protein